MQLEVIFAGNRLATCVLWSRDKSIKTKTESGNRFCVCVVQCSKFSIIVMFTNLEYRERESRRQATEDQLEKRRQTARARDKKWRHFFVGRTTWKFCSGGEKMRNASGHEGENKRQWKKSDTYDISSSKRVSRKFLEVSRCGRTKQRQRNVQKKCAARAKLLFC